jgi:hypothetical protein
MKKMKMSEIKISDEFLAAYPSEWKIEKCRKNWEKYGKQDRYIVVNNNNVLTDGYIQYLVLQENGIEYAQTINSPKHKEQLNLNKTAKVFYPTYRYKPTVYVYGHHPNSKDRTTYLWYIPDAWDDFISRLHVGNLIFCNTKFGCSPVVVDKIKKLDHCPVDIPVKRVASKTIKIVKK